VGGGNSGGENGKVTRERGITQRAGRGKEGGEDWGVRDSEVDSRSEHGKNNQERRERCQEKRLAEVGWRVGEVRAEENYRRWKGEAGAVRRSTSKYAEKKTKTKVDGWGTHRGQRNECQTADLEKSGRRKINEGLVKATIRFHEKRGTGSKKSGGAKYSALRAKSEELGFRGHQSCQKKKV